VTQTTSSSDSKPNWKTTSFLDTTSPLILGPVT